jgi:hypothetical protein
MQAITFFPSNPFVKFGYIQPSHINIRDYNHLIGMNQYENMDWEFPF